MLQQPRRLARSGAQRGALPHPNSGQRVFRAQGPAGTGVRKPFWRGKLPLLVVVALFLLAYRIMRVYNYVQEAKTRHTGRAAPMKDSATTK